MNYEAIPPGEHVACPWEESKQKLFCRDSHRFTTEPGSCIHLCGRVPLCNDGQADSSWERGHLSETETLPRPWGRRGPVLGLTSKGTIRNTPNSHKAAVDASFPGSSKMFLQRNALDQDNGIICTFSPKLSYMKCIWKCVLTRLPSALGVQSEMERWGSGRC